MPFVERLTGDEKSASCLVLEADARGGWTRGMADNLFPDGGQVLRGLGGSRCGEGGWPWTLRWNAGGGSRLPPWRGASESELTLTITEIAQIATVTKKSTKDTKSAK